MTQSSSRNCPELPGLDQSTLWLITILCNVLLIFLWIEEPWNEPESPRNINIDTFFWVILGFFLRRNVITFWLYKNQANVTGWPRTFWVILGHSGGHSGDFHLQCTRASLFVTCWQWCSFSHHGDHLFTIEGHHQTCHQVYDMHVDCCQLEMVNVHYCSPLYTNTLILVVVNHVEFVLCSTGHHERQFSFALTSSA
jgi:hypothetical protein